MGGSGAEGELMYSIVLPRRVQRAIGALQPAEGRRVIAAIGTLSHNPRPSGCIKLRNRPGWRIRVGNYRVVYEIDDDQRVVTILDVDHRRDVYR